MADEDRKQRLQRIIANRAASNGAAPEASRPSEQEIMKTILANPGMVMNAMTSRSEILEKMFDPRRNLDEECGYPEEITITQYRKMYDRELGKRVVNVYPEETWKQLPDIYEDADPEVSTPFEESWADIQKRHNVLHYMQRVDELSGIGHYGLLLIGIDDGLPLSEPAAGINERGEAVGIDGERNIIYLRVFDESLVDIAGYEADPTNPRYGRPTYYNITFEDPRQNVASVVAPPDQTEKKVHWSRVVHIADNRTTSEVLGTPRQKAPWNRVADSRKILGGSAEMYYRGGFPGVSLETQPGLENAEIDQAATERMMFDYMNGLQRYLALTGMSAKSLAPQISDPSSSFEVQVKAICILIGVPYRVFMGIEEGVVSGDQATKAWDGRLANRQTRYVTPMLINEVLRRFVALGVLVAPVEEDGWTVDWPDAHAPSEMDQAAIAGKKTEAFAKYVAGGVDTLIPPFEFLTIICGLEKPVVDAILKAAVEHINAASPELDDVAVPGRNPTPPELIDGEEDEAGAEEETSAEEDK